MAQRSIYTTVNSAKMNFLYNDNNDIQYMTRASPAGSATAELYISKIGNQNFDDLRPGQMIFLIESKNSVDIFSVEFFFHLFYTFELKNTIYQFEFFLRHIWL